MVHRYSMSEQWASRMRQVRGYIGICTVHHVRAVRGRVARPGRRSWLVVFGYPNTRTGKQYS
jgi:hypothetical protein